MIDIKLTEESKQTSPIILSVEKSWRKRLRQHSERPQLPFVEPNMEVTVNEKLNFIIKGYCGTHTILFVYGDRETFSLKEPIVKKNFSLFGLYSSHGRLKQLITNEAHGAHYRGMTSYGYYELCLGDIDFKYFVLNTYSGLRDLCCKVMESRKTINLHSLGDVYLPGYSQLKYVLKDDLNTREKLEVMLTYGLIETIL